VFLAYFFEGKKSDSVDHVISARSNEAGIASDRVCESKPFVSDDRFEAVSQRDHLLFQFSSLTFCPRPFHPDFDKKSTSVLRSKHGY
jgi:hypothetical protein